MQHLILEMRRDEGLMTDKADELFNFLQSFAEGIGRRGESEADVKSKFFRVVTEVLLTFSPEQYAKAKDLCNSLHNLLKESWSGSGMDDLKRSRKIILRFHFIRPFYHLRPSVLFPFFTLLISADPFRLSCFCSHSLPSSICSRTACGCRTNR